MAGKLLVADAFDTYDPTLHLFQSPSPYTVAAASFNFYSAGGTLLDTNHNVFSIVSAPAAGAVPWNIFANNHYLHVDCTQVGGPPIPYPNPGPGLYRNAGNNYQALIWGGWIRVVTLPHANVAIWRLNDSKF